MADFPLAGIYQVNNSPDMLNRFEHLIDLWRRRGQITRMKRKLIFEEILYILVCDMRQQKIEGDTNHAIEKTIEFMVHYYQKKVTLEELSQMAGMSVSHYCRLFKRYTGYSPIDYVTHLRMDRAKELLVMSGFRLKSIAQSVGYDDEFYFSRRFKDIVGLSPTQFAQHHDHNSDNHARITNEVDDDLRV